MKLHTNFVSQACSNMSIAKLHSSTFVLITELYVSIQGYLEGIKKNATQLILRIRPKLKENKY